MRKKGRGYDRPIYRKNTGKAADAIWSHLLAAGSNCFRAQDGIAISLKDSVYLQLISIQITKVRQYFLIFNIRNKLYKLRKNLV
jgi:hypothetical protein